MPANLFRKEAIKENTNSLYGNTLLKYPDKFKLFYYGIVSTTLIIVLLLIFTKAESQISAQGIIVSSKGLLTYDSPHEGIIREILVENKSLVGINQPVLKIELKEKTSDVLASQKLKIQLLEKEANFLKNKIDQLNNHYNTEIISTKKRAKLLKSKLATSRIIKQKQEVIIKKLEGELLKSKDFFERKLITREKLVAKELSLASAEKELLYIVLNLKEQKSKLINLNDLQKNLSFEKEKEISKIQNEISIKKINIQEYRNKNSFTVYSRRKGKIFFNNITKSSSISKGTVLFQQLPEGSSMYPVLYIKEKYISKVKRGQKVILEYIGFPKNEFGVHEGVVKEIDNLEIDDTIKQSMNLEGSYYKISVALKSKNNHETLRLSPKMEARAKVITGKKRLIKLLMNG